MISLFNTLPAKGSKVRVTEIISKTGGIKRKIYKGTMFFKKFEANQSYFVLQLQNYRTSFMLVDILIGRIKVEVSA